jgi:flagellar hook-basal body complex protein FliE
VSIASIMPVNSLLALVPSAAGPVAATPPAPATGAFSRMLSDGIDQVQDKVSAADKLVNAFVLDDSIPVHQVSFALEQAKLSLELMLQVRSRLVEGYQQLMTMQM